MKIIRIYRDDIAGVNLLSALDAQLFDHPWTPNQWIAEVENDENQVFLIYYDEELFFPIGLLSYGFSGDSIELKKIGILGEFRRKHFAAEAMEFMLENAHTGNFNNIIIEVAVTNTAAIRLYEKMGFYKISTRKKYYNNLVDAWVMQKEI